MPTTFSVKQWATPEITVKASAMDVAMFQISPIEGKTDHDGAYRFDLTLPPYFAGRPLDHGSARVLVEATVKDSAGHSETRGEPITVSPAPLIITAVPEGGTLVPNLENQVFVLTSYPDGTPARADLKVLASGNPDQQVSTDEGGIAIVYIKAGSINTEIGRTNRCPLTAKATCAISPPCNCELPPRARTRFFCAIGTRRLPEPEIGFN